MQEPSKETVGAVIILLVIAAIVANLLVHAYIESGPVLLIILSAICGLLASRYEGRS